MCKQMRCSRISNVGEGYKFLYVGAQIPPMFLAVTLEVLCASLAKSGPPGTLRLESLEVSACFGCGAGRPAGC